MKKINNKKSINYIENKKLEFSSFKEVFKKDLKSESFKRVYSEELVRLQVAHRVKELRVKNKFTQKQVAQRAEMPQSVIARIESGTHSVSLGTLSRIAKVFNKEVQIT